MTARKLLALLVAATALVGGVAAAGAATPADGQASDQTPDGPDANAPDDAGGSDADTAENQSTSEDADGSDENANADENDEAARGPPSELPDQVPDHVSEVHDRIGSYLDGEIDNLGHALSDLLGDDGDSGDEASQDAEGGQSTGSEHASDAAPVA
ncbi:hypothetical protein [Halobacterium yunchengense]|uniref:hypothetical protein n=1 Tax=Halobacterium yunchengense TaxID=3108497 RepID=UPI0030096790